MLLPRAMISLVLDRNACAVQCHSKNIASPYLPLTTPTPSSQKGEKKAFVDCENIVCLVTEQEWSVLLLTDKNIASVPQVSTTLDCCVLSAHLIPMNYFGLIEASPCFGVRPSYSEAQKNVNRL